MYRQQKNKKWNWVEKTAFRFLFIFFCLNSWCANNLLRPIFYPRLKNLINLASIPVKPLFWLDKHIYHIGYCPSKNAFDLIDSPLSWVIVITIFWVSLAGCILWTALDKKRLNYHRLNYWFRLYLAYYLFIIMDFYAIFKITAAQMPFPNAAALLKPFGEYSRIVLLFDFMGASPGYSVFTGVCELLAAALVLYSRTRVLGALLMLTILINILSLNIFYNVMQKLLVINLLMVTIYLLSPFMGRLVDFFIFSKPATLAEEKYEFTTPWKKYVLSALMIFPAWVTFTTVLRGVNVARSEELRKQQSVYQVISFVREGDTIPPLLTDSFRIQKIVFTSYYRHQYLVLYSMMNVPSVFDYTRDVHKKTMAFTNAQLNCKDLPGNQLQLDGIYKKQEVSMRLQLVRLDSLPLVNEKIKWVRR
jgi:hypothetical protein